MSHDPATESYRRAASAIEQADALVFAAGAGMGVDSGLPDFRGSQGFWNAYPALGKAQIGFTQIASPQTFHRDPRLAWGFYGHRMGLYRSTAPHRGFAILQRWARRMNNGAFTFTSNVDGQFQKAGVAPSQIHECHGSIHFLQCLVPCSGDIWPADELELNVDVEACQWLGRLPQCPRCKGLARPNILMFGDGGWLESRSHQQKILLDLWLRKARRPVVVEIGAGTHVPSVRYFTESVAERPGGRLIRINPREATVPFKDDVEIVAGAATALEAIEELLRS